MEQQPYRDKRERILRSAKEVFASHGYYGSSVSAIVKRAGVARGTFYLYFDNKRHLFESILDSLLEELEGRVERILLGPTHPPPLEQLRHNLLRVFALVQEEKELAQILLHQATRLDPAIDEKLAAFYGEIAQRIESSLRQGVQMGLVRRCNAHVTAQVVIGAVKEVAARLTLNDPDLPPIEGLVEELLQFALESILTNRPSSLLQTVRGA